MNSRAQKYGAVPGAQQQQQEGHQCAGQELRVSTATHPLRCTVHRHIGGEQDAKQTIKHKQSNTGRLLLTDVGSGHRVRRDARRVVRLKHERQRVPAKRMRQCTQRVKQSSTAPQT